MTRFSSPLGALLLFLLSQFPAPYSFAAIPMQINHQGVIKVSGTPFNGNGDFRFALVDPDTGQNRWTNDGSKVGQTGTPNAAANLPIINGIYNVRLGDQALANMVSIPSTVFNDDNIVLRIWFSDGVNGIQQLAPDQPITSSPYAFHALTAENATSAITATSALTATNATSANSAVTATTASTALDTSTKISTHNSSPTEHSNIQLDGARITSGKIDNARLNTGTGNGLDADMLDGAQAAALEESSEIITSVITHDTNSNAHTNLVIAGSQIQSGKIDNARLNTGTGNGLDADLVDGFHSTSLLLTGEVRMWAGPISAIPSGWLICNGTAVSRTTYANLFGVLGTIYGSGDGTTTFNLPDLRDRSPMGARQDDGGVPKTNVTGALTQTGGEAAHTLTVNEMPGHDHHPKCNMTTSTYSPSGNYMGQTGATTLYDPYSVAYMGATSTAGGDQPHNVLDPYLAIVFIIKT